MQKKKHSGEELCGELGETFNFTRGDLEANRAGFLSYRQQSRLRFRWIPGCIFLVVLLIGLAPLTALFWSLFDSVPNESPITIWIMIILASIPIMVLIAWGSFATIKSLREFQKRRVMKYEGKVTFDFTTQKHHYVLCFEDNRLVISDEAYELMNSDTPYKIYYLPESNEILSIDS